MQQYLARLEGLAKIFRVFQAALLPPLPALDAPQRFAAVTAASNHPLLPCALMECAEHVLSALDAAPDFCLLQTRAPGERPELAPQLARTFLRGGRWGLQPAPVLIGSTDRALDAAVVLTAATLPGTAVYPFHAESAALPELEDGAWRKLVPPPGAGQAQAAVLLSAPDFRQSAGELGQRLNAVLQPQLRLLTRSAAAGEGSPGTALFLGDAAVRGPSAVGAVFRGPAAGVDNLVSHLLACQHKHGAERP